jgi:ectoine hydrolase
MSENLPFSKSEYDRRLELTRNAMEANGIDLLFLEDPANMAWLTGYDGWSFYVHQGVIITHDQDPIWWGRFMDGQGAKRTVWMNHANIRPYPDDYVQNTVMHPMEHLARLISGMGHASGRIGVEMENYYFSAKAWVTLKSQLPDADFIDATALVNWQRLVKSEEELVFIRRAARISEKMIDGIVERVEPGLKKNELVAEIYRDAISGADGHWGDYASIVPLLPSGPDASAAHLTWDGREFKKGEATFFELSGCYRRYHAPFCRTVFLGKPFPEILEAEKVAQEGIAAGLEAARPGNTTGDIARAFYAALEKAGIHRDGRCGYAIGLSYPPDWGERTASIRKSDTTVLEPNMTFHFMPAIWMDDWGLEITEPIRIRESGAAECLCDRPRKLFVKE